MDFRFIKIKEGTIRACCENLQHCAAGEGIVRPQKIVLVCSIEDIMSTENTDLGKRIVLQHPQKYEFEQAIRLKKHVTLFESKIKDIWDYVQAV